MRTLASTALAFAVLATPATLMTTTPAGAIECPPYASEEMKRPGGYCDQLDPSNSLTTPGTSTVPTDCPDPARFFLPPGFFEHADMVVLLATGAQDPCDVNQ